MHIHKCQTGLTISRSQHCLNSIYVIKRYTAICVYNIVISLLAHVRICSTINFNKIKVTQCRQFAWQRANFYDD